MDALKKAEQEKKEAAKRLKEAEEPSGNEPQELSLEVDERESNSFSEDETVAADSATEDSDKTQNIPVFKKEEIKSYGLSLSPAIDEIPVHDQTQEVESTSFTPNLTADLNHNNVELSLESDGDEEDLTLSETLSLSNDAEKDITTVQADATLQDKELYDQLISDSDTIASDTIASETLTGSGEEYFSATVSAEELARDIGTSSPTPVAAQTVFSASAQQPNNQVKQWGVFVLLCTLIVASLSFFIFNYTVPVERKMLSPMVAKDVEIQAEEPIEIIKIPESLVSLSDIETGTFSGDISKVIENGNKSASDEVVSDVDDTVATIGSNEEELVSESIGESNTEVTRKENEEIWYPSEDYSLSQENLIEEVAEKLPEKIEPDLKLIEISKSKSVDNRSSSLSKAYENYNAGNYKVAEINYREVLNTLPENRDALLGLAAIMTRKGDNQQAYTTYLNVLKLYPGDTFAEAALINFQSNGKHAQSESVLKSLVQKDPENSFLYYSLGRLYASQARWPEAQQSFFSAYSKAPRNPDYAYNLAISLEHIGQTKAAIDYYSSALDLVNESVASFDNATVLSRIRELTSLDQSH